MWTCGQRRHLADHLNQVIARQRADMKLDFSSMTVEDIKTAQVQLSRLLEEKTQLEKSVGLQKLKEVISRYGLDAEDIARMVGFKDHDQVCDAEAGIPSIMEILTSVSVAATAKEVLKHKEETGDNNLVDSRFPVVITGDARKYYDIQCAVLGMSLSSLCGTILNEVAKESLRRIEDKL